MVGALFSLWLEGGTINLYTTIALVTLVGLVSKHGILLVQFANQELENTGSVTEALLAAAEVRLRPILMPYWSHDKFSMNKVQKHYSPDGLLQTPYTKSLFPQLYLAFLEQKN